jgi:hypothetical protein
MRLLFLEGAYSELDTWLFWTYMTNRPRVPRDWGASSLERTFMADQFRIGSSSPRSTEDLLAEWNLREPDAFDQSNIPPLAPPEGESCADRAGESCADGGGSEGRAGGMKGTGISPADENPPERGQSMAFLAEFEVRPGGDERCVDPQNRAPGTTSAPRAGNRRPPTR